MTKGVSQLFKESWKIYKSKFKIFLKIITVPAVLILIGTFIPLVGKEPIKAFVIAITLLLIAIFIGLFTILAIFFSLKDNLGVKESCKKSFKAFFSFFWVCFLMFCLSISWIIAGIILPLLFIHLQFLSYFLEPLEFGLAPDYPIGALIVFSGVGFLFIAIGAILFIKFFPSIYILIFEGEKGIKVLSESRELVAGKFWKVLWRIFALGFVIAIIVSLIALVSVLAGLNLAVMNIINYLFIWLIIPLCLIYGFLIYKDLEENKTETFGQILLKKKKIGFIKIGTYVIIGILGLWLGVGQLVSMANLIYRADDEPLRNDQDLWPPRIEVSVQDNAFYILAPYFIRDKERYLEYWPEQEKYALKAIEIKELYFPWEEREFIDGIIQGKEWDQEFVIYLLEKNRQVLEDFQGTAQLPYFQNPMTQNPVDISMDIIFPALGAILEMARINAINSIYLFNQGKEEQAFEQAIKIIEIGQMLQDNQGALISYLIGGAIKEIGFERIRMMTLETTLSSGVLKEHIVQLEKFKLNEKGLANALKLDYIFMINALGKIFGDISSSYFLKPNQTHGKFAEFARVNINNVYKLCGDAIEPEIPEQPLWWIEENWVGRILFETVAVVIGPSQRCEEDFSVIATQLLLAIRTYQLETGEIPTSLDKLMPKYISEIPRDPFDGEPIRFCPKRKMVWSVGRDLIDEGGSKEEYWRKMPDPTFEINFK